MVDIVECSNFPEEEFLKVAPTYLEQRKPVVFRGVPLGECCSKWQSVDYLTSKLQSKTSAVHVTTATNMDFLHKNFRYETLNMAELCHRIFTSGPLPQYFIHENEAYYLRSLGSDSRSERSHFHEQFPELSGDLRIPQIFPPEVYFSSVFRMSSAHLRLWNHYDVMDNILIEVVGRKSITFFSPYDAEFLYLQGDKSEVQDPTDYDSEKFPLMSRATPISVDILPGDVIFIPALWFHSVKSVEPSIAVNVFWCHLPLEQYDPKDVYGNRDPVLVSRAAQSLANCVKLMRGLPMEYQHLFGCKLVDKLRTSLLVERKSLDDRDRSNVADHSLE